MPLVLAEVDPEEFAPNSALLYMLRNGVLRHICCHSWSRNQQSRSHVIGRLTWSARAFYTCVQTRAFCPCVSERARERITCCPYALLRWYVARTHSLTRSRMHSRLTHAIGHAHSPGTLRDITAIEFNSPCMFARVLIFYFAAGLDPFLFSGGRIPWVWPLKVIVPWVRLRICRRCFRYGIKIRQCRVYLSTQNSIYYGSSRQLVPELYISFCVNKYQWKIGYVT